MGQERDREGGCEGVQGTEDLRIGWSKPSYPLSRAYAASRAWYSQIPYPRPGVQGTT
jgi:hypothetical protein